MRPGPRSHRGPGPSATRPPRSAALRRASALLCAAFLPVLLLAGACGSDEATTEGTAAVAAGATTVGTAAVDAGTTTVGTATEPVVKEVLATMTDPPGGAGSTLTLIRYTIAPGAELAPHIHPGVQLASIESGTLTYTVESGTAVVHRADGTTEDLTGPTRTQLGPGDAVQETGDMVHFGANNTDDPVVILATLLTENGKDLAVVVEEHR